MRGRLWSREGNPAVDGSCCAVLAVLVLEQILVGAAAVRVSEQMDLRMLKTYRVLKDIVTIAANRGLDICVWISVPCIAGRPWRHINAKKGIVTGCIALTIYSFADVLQSRV